MSTKAPIRRVHGNDRLDARRVELFRLAAPVFRARGYREATIKELAHACHLSPAGFYHYFPSKLALATYVLRRDNSPEAAEPSGLAAAEPEHPLGHVSRLLDIFLDQIPLYLLAIDLARDAGVAFDAEARGRLFSQGERSLVPLLAAAVPGLSLAESTGTAQALLALLVGPFLTGLDGSPAAIRERQVRLLRDRLLAQGVDSAAFESAMQVRELAPGVTDSVVLERTG